MCVCACGKLRSCKNCRRAFNRRKIMKRARGKSTKSAKTKDFPKKRRKVGKEKRTPDNATAISFKTGAVVIPAQLEESQEPTTKKKLPVQTLINHLKHYRVSVRHDALMGLREIFQEHPTLLLPNLAKIVDHVFVVLIDQEASVRHGLFRLLKLVFSSVTPEQLQPFFAVLVAHLTCGFTHIDDRIQLDSLKIFDLVLAHFPRLLVPYAQELLPLLVGMISRQEAQYATASKAVKVEHALASNPSSKLSRQTSRLEIFTQLCKFLQVLLQSFETCDASIGPTFSQAPVVDLQNREVLVSQGHEFEPTHSAFCDLATPIPHVAVVQTYGIMIPETAFLSSPGSGHIPHQQMSGKSHCSVFPERGKFIEFSKTLVSLLLECWIECSPSELIHGVSVKRDTLSIMETILNLLSLLLKLVLQVDQAQTDCASLRTGLKQEPTLMSVLCKRFQMEFQRHFMAYFPFSNFKSPKKQFFAMDFTVSQIMLLLLSTTSSKGHSTAAQNTVSAICEFYGNLDSGKKPIAAASQILTSCVQIMVEVLPHLLTSLYEISDDSQRQLFSGVWNIYVSCHPHSSARKMLIRCFSNLHAKVFKNEVHVGCRSLLHSELLLPWQQTLFDLLVQLSDSNLETSAQVVESIALAAMHGESSCLQGLQENISSILGPESVVPRLPPPTQRRVFELLWHLPQLETPVLSLLTESIISGRYNTHLMAYLIQIVHHRSTTSPPLETTLAHYLSFMFTLIVGSTWEELKSLESQPSPESESCVPSELANPADPVFVAYRLKIAEVVCECLLATEFSNQVLELLHPAIEILLERLQKLPTYIAIGILKLGCCLVPEHGVPEQLVPVFSHLCFSCLVAMENSDSDSSTDVAITELTNQMLTLSQPVMQAVIHKFQENVTAMDPDVQLLARTFVDILNNPAINASLRECREDVCITAAAITGQLIGDLSSWKQQLELAVMKFRTT